jgi:hypothetical protein
MRRRKGYIHASRLRESSMSNVNSPADDPSIADSGSAVEHELQGSALNNSEQKAATIGGGCGTERNADSELHLEGEAEAKADTLYCDGIDVEEEYDSPAGTRGSLGTIP